MAKEYPKDSLGDRMKEYEAAETERYFMRGLPLYARIDGRAFHTFTRGLESQFPIDGEIHHQLFKAMQYVCRQLVDELNADIGFVQSDEISLGWKDVRSAPFDGRVFKLESVIASQATGFFYKFVFSPDFDDDNDAENPCSFDRLTLQARTRNIVPSFDCRVFQVPNLIELVNLFVWRENDAIKNSVSSYAQEFFSAKELNGKTQAVRVEMLAGAGHDWKELPLTVRRGTYYARKLVEREGPNGEKAIRSVVEEKFEHEQLAKIENKTGYFFNGEDPILIDRSNNGGDARRVNVEIAGDIPPDVRELISDFPEKKEA